MRHNASVLALLGAQGGERVISINVVFFMSLLGWQSMLALFLASFIGPGQVSPDLANNALALYLARPFSRTEYVLGKMSVLLILLSLMTWVPGLLLFCLQGYLEGWQWMHDNVRFAVGHLLRRVDLDSDAVAAGAGALRLGEMEARGRRADVRRLLRGGRLRRDDQRRAAHQLGAPFQYQLPDRLGLGQPLRGREQDHQRRALLPRAARRGAAVVVLLGRAGGALPICLYMLARKIRGTEVVR